MKEDQSASIQSKIQEEATALLAVIGLYCRKKHSTKKSLCENCASLREYAIARLECCVFLPQKPTCARCPLHCYTPLRRQQIRQVMRYAAPRFYFFRPQLAIKHFWHTFQRPSKQVQEVAEKLKAKAGIKSTTDTVKNQMD